MSDRDWDERYQQGRTPWDTGRPSYELHRVVTEDRILPCRAADLGCGTGVNAVWLALQGFDVTAIDISRLAIERARERAARAGAAIRFLQGDVLDARALAGPFEFFFDRGCYHAVRMDDVQAYLGTLVRITAPGAVGLVLAGNAREQRPKGEGPPVVSEEEIRGELGSMFEIVRLREFRLDTAAEDGIGPLAWSCLLKRMKTGREKIAGRTDRSHPFPASEILRKALQYDEESCVGDQASTAGSHLTGTASNRHERGACYVIQYEDRGRADRTYAASARCLGPGACCQAVASECGRQRSRPALFLL